MLKSGGEGVDYWGGTHYQDGTVNTLTAPPSHVRTLHVCAQPSCSVFFPPKDDGGGCLHPLRCIGR